MRRGIECCNCDLARMRCIVNILRLVSMNADNVVLEIDDAKAAHGPTGAPVYYDFVS